MMFNSIYGIDLSEKSVKILTSFAIKHTSDKDRKFNSKNYSDAYRNLESYLNSTLSREELEIFLRKSFHNIDLLTEIDEIMSYRDQTDNNVTHTDVKSTIIGNEVEGNVKKYKRKPCCKWSHKDDQKLIYAICCYSLNDWKGIIRFLGDGKTRAMCTQRWCRVLDPNLNNGEWSIGEDDCLMTLVELYGTRSWKKISTYMENRSDTQCRYRYQKISKFKSLQTKNTGFEFVRTENEMEDTETQIYEEFNMNSYY